MKKKTPSTSRKHSGARRRKEGGNEASGDVGRLRLLKGTCKSKPRMLGKIERDGRGGGSVDGELTGARELSLAVRMSKSNW